MVTWRKNYPKSTTELSDIPVYHSDNFNTIQSGGEYEHYSPLSSNSTLSGYHRVGAVGAIFEGTTAEIAALSSPNAGALARDTELGVLKYYSGSAWIIMGAAKWSRMRAYRSGSDITVTSGASAEILVFNVEDYDTLAEYNTSTGVFTALASGFYLVNANVTFIASGSMTTSGQRAPNSDITTTSWTGTPTGAPNMHHNVDETWGSPNDADYNRTATSEAKNIFGMSAINNVPSGATGITLNVYFRAKYSGCTCNTTCYQQSCTSYYQHGCSNCYADCNSFHACVTCNGACNAQGKGGCTVCYGCYQYSNCVTCNGTCYNETCSQCHTPVTYGSCSCNAIGYIGIHNMTAYLRGSNGTNYPEDSTRALETDFTNYASSEWAENPVTGLPWTAATISGALGMGYAATLTQSGENLSAYVSNVAVIYQWNQTRPSASLMIYKDSAVYETAVVPLEESAGAPIYQTASITSMIYLTAGQTIDIRYTKSMFSDIITAGTTNTNLSIHRLAGPLG